MKTNRRSGRRGSSLVGAWAVVIGAACSSSTTPLPAGPLGPPASERKATRTLNAQPSAELDLLFMVDNSATMNGLQAKMALAFPAFMNALGSAPEGLPNLHVAVVSSDLGSGPTAPTPSCRVNGDGGQFQSAPRASGGNCKTGLPAGQTFLSSVDGIPNFTGNIADALTCMAMLGDMGCGFEHQFASVLRALEPGPNQPEGNKGFLRPSAYLGIVMITNEDDCSAPPDSPIFDTMSRTVTDKWGPLASFRCNEFGHLCNGMKPPRSAAILDHCTSAEDGTLLRVSDVIQRMRALKNGDASKILVAAITGPPGPYEVFIPPNTPESIKAGYSPPDVPAIRHACVNVNDATFGDPSVRIKQWVDAFNGNLVSICDDSFVDDFQRIALTLAKQARSQLCWPDLVDADRGSPGVQPSCVVTDIATDGTRTPIPSCVEAPGTLPCWEVGSGCPPVGKITATQLGVKRGPSPTKGLSAEFTCSECIAGVSNPGCTP